MRIRVIRCPEDAHDLPWVNASECDHWSMTCPRAKKAKKAHHKLKNPTKPGFDIILTRADHEYRPEVDSQERWEAQEQKLLKKGWRWNQVPSAMRYADCECGLPWMMHLPEWDGPARYLGKWEPTREGEARLKPAPPGLLIHCALGCGLLAAE
jgi:hypothetical protein